MSEEFFVFLFVLFLLAVIGKQDFVFVVIYLFAGAFLLGGWWTRKAQAGVHYLRTMEERAFLYEDIPVRLEIENKGWLPILWMRLHDSIPLDLATSKNRGYVFGLGPFARKEIDYRLLARKRGFYKVGPLRAYSGDLLGLHREYIQEADPSTLTVYPHIVPLTNLKLPSSSPMGTLRHHQPIFEDPTRVLNKRDYVAGDSLRRIDWKASATAGRLQVKQFEPSIALETVLCLDLSHDGYEMRKRYDASELAIVIAASVGSWVSGHKQSLGLITNGVDPLADAGEPVQNGSQQQEFTISVPPRKGRSHLIRILDVMARIQTGNTQPVVELLRKQSVHLAWGTTVMIITGRIDDGLFDVLFNLRRSGMNPVIVLAGQVPNRQEIRSKMGHFKFPFYHFEKERDLDLWR